MQGYKILGKEVLALKPTGSVSILGSISVRESIFAGASPSVGTSGGYCNIYNIQGPYYSSFYFYSVDDIDSDAFGKAIISANAEEGILLRADSYNATNPTTITLTKGNLSILTATSSISSSNYIVKSSNFQITGSLKTSGSNSFFGALTVGNITSTPANENSLNLYPPPAGGTGEGGQLMLAASGGLYTSASMLDTYQNYFRVLRGSNTGGSNAQLVGIDLQTGNMSVAGAVIPSAWSPGDVIQMRAFKPGDSNVYAVGTTATSTSNECFFSCSFTPKSTTSYVVVNMYAKYEPIAGASGNDDYYSTLTVNGASGTEIGYGYQKFTTSNNNRSGVLFPLLGRYTNSSTSAISICANIRRGTADDNISLDYTNASSMTMTVTEIGR